jgi:hypothetical protein
MLIGGTGRDEMHLGLDSDIDRVRLSSINDSTVGSNRDLIFDFKAEDLIDLSVIDANQNTLGNQAFAWSTTGAAAYAVWIVSGTDSIVSGDVTGDGSADFEMQLVGVTSMAQEDFVL